MYRHEILPWNGDFGLFHDKRVCRSTVSGQQGNNDQAARPRSYSVFGNLNGPVPYCFDSEEQWQAWQKFDEITKSGPTQYCQDCTKEYAARMRQEGRCAHPEVKFYRVNGALVGLSKPPPELQDEKAKPHTVVSQKAAR